MKEEIDHHLIEASKLKENKRKLEFIKAVVAGFYGEPINVFASTSRRKEHVHVRHVAMFMTSKLTKLGLAEIGRSYNRDHASVIHAKKKINGWLDYDVAFRQEMNEIEQLIIHRLSIDSDEPTLADEYYFIDLDNINSLRLGKGKALILKGFTDEEIKSIKAAFRIPNTETRTHKNTGMYILDSKEKQD